MVVVKIGDGLGNQMYNYVCGYSVAKRDNDTLLLDTSDVDNSTFREYGLDVFNIEFTERESFSNRTVFHKIYKRLRRNIKYRCIYEDKKEALPEDYRVYNKKLFRNKYLHGYFQNYCYYESCKEEIDKQFTPKEPLRSEVTELINRFSSGEFCSVHVRGGDIEPLSVNYYRQAIEHAAKAYPGVRFVLFSNDKKTALKYADELCPGNYECIWDMGKFKDYEELFLMKSFPHHIISDSTFARWAAFLSNDEETIAPKTTCKNRAYPDSWKIFTF